MGTAVRITLFAEDAVAADTAARAAFNRVAEIDNRLSDYKPESELMGVCRKAGKRPVKVSEDLFRVLESAQKLSHDSRGAFDVTIGPIVQLWRAARQTGVLPDTEALVLAREHCGYKNVRLDARNRTVRLAREDMLIDLGGIAKGYAADEALKALRAGGVSQAIVALSGDIVCGDPPPGMQGWRVGVDPFGSGRPLRYVTLANQAISTAGDAEQFLEANGRRFSHIIDPRTAMALVNSVMVSVIARDGLTADGLDTTLSVMQLEGAEALLKSRGAAALMVQPDGRSSEIGGFPAR